MYVQKDLSHCFCDVLVSILCSVLWTSSLSLTFLAILGDMLPYNENVVKTATPSFSCVSVTTD